MAGGIHLLSVSLPASRTPRRASNGAADACRRAPRRVVDSPGHAARAGCALRLFAAACGRAHALRVRVPFLARAAGGPRAVDAPGPEHVCGPYRRSCGDAASALRGSARRRPAGGPAHVVLVLVWYVINDLVAVVAANARTLQELSVPHSPLVGAHRGAYVEAPHVAQLLRAAPGLRLLECNLLCDGPEVLQILQNEPPYGPLRLTGLTIGNGDLQHNPPADWLAVAAALATHRAIESVSVWNRIWPRAVDEADALVDALIALPLLHYVCIDSTPQAHALARLLCRRMLTDLSVGGNDGNALLFPRESAIRLCIALDINTQLGSLYVGEARFWHDIDMALCFLRVLAMHPTLHSFSLVDNAVPPQDAAAAGAALGEMVARMPSLHKLDITRTSLRNTGLLPFLNALPDARCLRVLWCPANRMSNALARDCLLPAVMACAPLRELWSFKCDAAREAERLLKLRVDDDALKGPAMSAAADDVTM